MNRPWLFAFLIILIVSKTNMFLFTMFAHAKDRKDQSKNTSAFPLPERNPDRLVKTAPIVKQDESALKTRATKESKDITSKEPSKVEQPVITSALPLPERNPKRVKEEVKPEGWPEEEIAKAQKECDELLKGLPIVYEKLPPLKEGSCGTPAPILLMALGEKGEVKVTPHATINCKMAKSLQKWITESVQPQAKATMGSPVIEIRNAASYACRNRYNNPLNTISEHAYANALDISEFTFENKTVITLLDSWGPTEKEIKAAALLAEKKAKEEALKKQAALKKESEKQKSGPRPTDGKSAVSQVTTAKLVEDKQKIDIQPASKSQNEIGKNESHKNDGKAGQNQKLQDRLTSEDPQPQTDKTAKTSDVKSETAQNNKDSTVTTVQGSKPVQPEPPKDIPDMKFLKSIHISACKIFGTILGPESNDAHKNHFHLDLMNRRSKSYCE